MLDVRVPNLILQPIVENAMRHAIGNSTSGRIEVTAVPRNGVVRIEVKDNGPGIQVDRNLEGRRGRVWVWRIRAHVSPVFTATQLVSN